jgi:hypothetical protein
VGRRFLAGLEANAKGEDRSIPLLRKFIQAEMAHEAKAMR